MKVEDLIEVIDFIENYYSIKLTDGQIKALKEELKDYTKETFFSEVKKPLLISVKFFTIAELHRIIEICNENKKYQYLYANKE